ncbi:MULTISPECIES: flavin reductase family protein [unclassified Leifsonia]|uniref:flavin reductase family protein n=1 Tax=unclassified Leifsonia TaxID=2663824 RepID=UPI000A18BE28|nr:MULTISPECIES: flavin reductase family protein [unclassified Leifsonia]QIZ97827.1 flavin reductase family protein [Leifsonia sp. PS1209]
MKAVRPLAEERLSPANGVTHVAVRPKVLYTGTPVFLVATENDEGTFNLAPASSYWALGQMMVLGIESDGQTIENLTRRADLTVNFASPELWSAVEVLAEVTGRNVVPDAKADRYRYVRDKFALAGLHPEASDLVVPPRVAECALQLEARARRLTTGIEPGYVIVEAEVVRVHADPRLLVDGTDRIDPQQWNPIIFSFRQYFQLGASLGARGSGEVDTVESDGPEAATTPGGAQ